MVVQHNMQAANANRQLGIITSAQSKSTEKLSSGYKINRAADDAAGLAISEKMRSQIRGLDKASSNAQDGISAVQTAEGALNEVHSILQRMNELATQAANDTNTSVDRSQIQLEINQLTSEIDRIASTTQFNTQNLLDGTFTNKNLQVGSLSGQTINISIISLTSSALGLFDGADLKTHWTSSDIQARYQKAFDADYVVSKTVTGKLANTFKLSRTSTHAVFDKKLSVSTNTRAGSTMSKVQRAIDVVSTMRANLGSIQNRLEHTIANLDTTSENTSAAESRIRDTDMAKEMVTYSKNNILQQAGQSMLAQANQSTQGVLSLLQ